MSCGPAEAAGEGVAVVAVGAAAAGGLAGAAAPDQAAEALVPVVARGRQPGRDPAVEERIVAA